ncbi:MAG: coproporphyrinogen III oxidase, partial [Bacteroidia bacterium]|nr:coproporphyrinogen III oxidase [Bacteroidia bacterium]
NQSISCMEEAGKIGFNNFTIDLIYGIPQLSIEEWIKTVDCALDLPINHISAYSLTLENNTPYKRLVDQKKYKKPDNDLASKHFEILIEKMESKGWEQYEVSNFCMPGEYSKHNTAYWLGKPYLGIGPSAHSFKDKKRYWNISDNKKYVSRLKEGELFHDGEELTIVNQFNERILTGLRTKWGVNLNALQDDFHFDLQIEQTKNLEVWKKKGWIVLEDRVLKLSKTGYLFADFISSELFLDEDYSSQTLS